MNINKEIVALRQMSVSELRTRYAEITGEETNSRHKDYLIRRIAWQMQARAEGGLSERARARARELAASSDVRMTAPRGKPADGPSRTATLRVCPDNRLPMPGAIITRQYKGQTIEVHVLPHGFDYQGVIYRSLSSIAKAVTGTHWNGYHFFKLNKHGENHG